MVQIKESSFEILTAIDSQVILKHIERCGRTCYQSFDKALEGSAERFVKHITERHHESVLEHASISVKFILDRGITHELVRHRLASFSQESTRYCCYAKEKFLGEITVIKPCELEEGTLAYSKWLESMEEAEKCYLELLECGVKPETARSVLPTCLKAEIVVTANLREWRHIFHMRTSSAAHPDIRLPMRSLCQEFRKHIPVVFDDITWD